MTVTPVANLGSIEIRCLPLTTGYTVFFVALLQSSRGSSKLGLWDKCRVRICILSLSSEKKDSILYWSLGRKQRK